LSEEAEENIGANERKDDEKYGNEEDVENFNGSHCFDPIKMTSFSLR
jgi:hypothetical protein